MSRRRPGSRFHAALDPRRWQLARLRCFQAAGWRCSRCHRAGRLEAHHRVRLEHGGPEYDQANLECLCSTCHVNEHRDDRVAPDRIAWRKFMRDVCVDIKTCTP